MLTQRFNVRPPGWMLAVLASVALTGAGIRADDPTTSRSAPPPSTQPAVADSSADSAIPINLSFAELANSDAAVRATALTRLLALKADDLPLLQKAVEETRPLVPAQALVLRQIVTQVFLSGEQYDGNPASGFLGVYMEQVHVTFGDPPPGVVTPNFGVIITNRMPGFAGARSLRDGDILLGLIERPALNIATTSEFSMLIREMGAGTVIHFQLLRDGQVMTIAVKLDARPLAADPFGGGAIEELLAHRKSAADDYWNLHFAGLVKEILS